MRKILASRKLLFTTCRIFTGLIEPHFFGPLRTFRECYASHLGNSVVTCAPSRLQRRSQSQPMCFAFVVLWVALTCSRPIAAGCESGDENSRGNHRQEEVHVPFRSVRITPKRSPGWWGGGWGRRRGGGSCDRPSIHPTAHQPRPTAHSSPRFPHDCLSPRPRLLPMPHPSRRRSCQLSLASKVSCTTTAPT